MTSWTSEKRLIQLVRETRSYRSTSTESAWRINTINIKPNPSTCVDGSQENQCGVISSDDTVCQCLCEEGQPMCAFHLDFAKANSRRYHMSQEMVMRPNYQIQTMRKFLIEAVTRRSVVKSMYENAYKHKGKEDSKAKSHAKAIEFLRNAYLQNTVGDIHKIMRVSIPEKPTSNVGNSFSVLPDFIPSDVTPEPDNVELTMTRKDPIQQKSLPKKIVLQDREEYIEDSNERSPDELVNRIFDCLENQKSFIVILQHPYVGTDGTEFSGPANVFHHIVLDDQNTSTGHNIFYGVKAMNLKQLLTFAIPYTKTNMGTDGIFEQLQHVVNEFADIIFAVVEFTPNIKQMTYKQLINSGIISKKTLQQLLTDTVEEQVLKVALQVRDMASKGLTGFQVPEIDERQVMATIDDTMIDVFLINQEAPIVLHIAKTLPSWSSQPVFDLLVSVKMKENYEILDTDSESTTTDELVHEVVSETRRVVYDIVTNTVSKSKSKNKIRQFSINITTDSEVEELVKRRQESEQATKELLELLDLDSGPKSEPKKETKKGKKNKGR